MLAKCSRCSQTFQTDRYGEQFCPFCGAAVMIAQPAGQGAAPGAPPPPGTPPGPAGEQPAPIDVPQSHGGWLTAAVETWKKAILDPMTFFNGLKPGPDVGGALGYVLVLLGVGGIFAGAVQYLQSMLQRAQFAQLQHQMSELPGESQKMISVVMKFLQPSPTQIFFTPIGAILGFFIGAALLHLALMIVGGNKQGFTGTIRALAFAQSPYLFAVIPMCGAFAAWAWTLVLSVIALSGVHKISIGRAIGAYALMVFSVCCLCLVPVGALAGFAASQAAHGASAVDVP